ncbi:unnamed protein product, partial [Discosporangium mesarthrocarpum]
PGLGSGAKAGTGRGFVFHTGGRLFVQTGECAMPPHRFLVVRTSDLGVEGMVDVPSLAAACARFFGAGAASAVGPTAVVTTIGTSVMGGDAGSSPHIGAEVTEVEDEKIAEGVEQEEKDFSQEEASGGDAGGEQGQGMGTAVGGWGEDAPELSCPAQVRFPLLLCCDGCLVHALVPSTGGAGGVTVLTLDPMDGFQSIREVELWGCPSGGGGAEKER